MSEESNQEGTADSAQGREESNPGGSSESEQGSNNPYGIPFYNPALVSNSEKGANVTVVRKTGEGEDE